MPRRTSLKYLVPASAVSIAALALAGCGNVGGGQAVAPAKPAAGQSTTVGVASNSSLGKILVDSQGRTLYLFQKDAGAKSMCFGECAHDWPPLRAAGKPTASGGANASLIATTARTGDGTEITYKGHPLYLFEGDKQPGDANGQGLTDFGGGWHALSPSGATITAQSTGAGY